MNQSFDTNNLLEMAIELQKDLYVKSSNKYSIEYEYLNAINNIVKDYIKYGNRFDELVSVCMDAEMILYD